MRAHIQPSVHVAQPLRGLMGTLGALRCDEMVEDRNRSKHRKGLGREGDATGSSGRVSLHKTGRQEFLEVLARRALKCLKPTADGLLRHGTVPKQYLDDSYPDRVAEGLHQRIHPPKSVF